jgi:hypothetical protein
LYYGDESRVSLDPCVPYGWQFAGEEVFMPAAKGAGLNCFALLTRANDLLFETTRRRITSQFIIEQFEHLSFSIRKTTVVVLDNAGVHTSAAGAGAAALLAAARAVHLLPAAVLAAPEYRRAAVA